MGKLYVGKKRIHKAYMKVRANTDFITATSSDILSGKISIDKDYNKITGSMAVPNSSVLTSETADATAVASDITSGKTGYANGAKITGTAVRKTPKNIINGIIESYNVANNNIIYPGDFVKFVEEECGCGYETTETQSTHKIIKQADLSFAKAYTIGVNKILLFHTENENTSYVSILSIENGVINIADTERINAGDRISSATNRIIPLNNNRYALLSNLGGPEMALIIVTISGNTINNVTTTNTGRYSYYHSIEKLDDTTLFVTYSGNEDVVSCLLFSINADNTVTSRLLSLDTVMYARNVVTGLVSKTKIVVVREDLIGDGPGSMFSLDISNLDLIQVGISELLVVQPIWLSATEVYPLAENVALIAYYIGYSGNGLSFVSIVRTDGIYTREIRQFSFNEYNIDPSSCVVCKLSETTVGIAQGSNSGVYITPIFLTNDVANAYAGTSLRLHRQSCMYIGAASPEINKLCLVYQEYNANVDREIRAKLFEVRGNVFTEVLTVYTDEPLTKTMVAKATGNDKISGIADTFGVGALYGGDTIDIIVPNI